MTTPTYNMTALAQVQGVGELANFANAATNNILFGIFSISIFFVLLLILKKWEFEKALASASFATFIVSAILTYGGFLNFMIPLVFLILTAFSGLYLYASSR